MRSVGLQAHFVLGADNPSVADMKANMQRLAALGLKVRISEIDVRMQPPFTKAKFSQQATVYRDALRACRESPNCVAFVT